MRGTCIRPTRPRDGSAGQRITLSPKSILQPGEGCQAKTGMTGLKGRGVRGKRLANQSTTMHSDATSAQLENGEQEHGGHEWGSRQQRPTCTRPNATYACRHSYATHPYRASGNDLEVVQEQLGHASIKTTTIYAKVTKEDKARAADALAKV